jgi:hypothetical protein
MGKEHPEIPWRPEKMRTATVMTLIAMSAGGLGVSACGNGAGDESTPGDAGGGGSPAAGASGQAGTVSASSGGATGKGGSSGGKTGNAGGTASGATTGSGGSNGASGATGNGGSSGASGATGNGGANASGGAAGSSAAGGSTGAGGKGSGGAGGSSGASGTGGGMGNGGTGGTGGTTIPTHCSAGLPSGAMPADVSHPTTVVGTGTAASCTFSALNAAVAKAGVITFDCGATPVTIGVSSTLILKTTADTVIDGGNKVTLDGQNSVQIMKFNSANFMALETRVTLQHLTFVNGKTTPTEKIPTAPAPCSQGYNDGEGGALYMRDGNLTVIDCTFSHNQAAQLGPDTGGGAIYVLGSKHGAIIARSVFTDNSASNAGAVGGLFCDLSIYESLFKNNTATGNGANNNDPSKCSAMNNGQNEVGSGGNGAAIYQDGGSATNVLLCGVDVENNKAGMGAFGGGVFMTSNDFSGTITVRDSTITGNTGGTWTQVKEGTLNLGTAFGVNAKSGSVQNSTLQGR